MKYLKIAFHPTRPLVLVWYYQKPIPWERFLVYVAHHDMHTYTLLYNSSFFGSSPKRYYYWTSKYLLITFLTMTSARKIASINKKIKLYEFSTGKTVGYLGFPAEEKCKYFIGREGQVPIETHDMRDFVCLCMIEQQHKLSLHMTIYNSNHAYIGKDLVYTLLHNKTLLFPLTRNSFCGLTYYFYKATVIFITLSNVKSVEKTVQFIIFSSTHQYLNQKEIYTIARYSEPLCDTELMRCLTCYRLSRSSMNNIAVFEIGCTQRTNLSKQINWFSTYQVQHISLHGTSIYGTSKYKSPLLNFSQEGVDTNRDILQINHNRNKHGKSDYYLKKFRVEQ
jgi:hypothetical protein